MQTLKPVGTVLLSLKCVENNICPKEAQSLGVQNRKFPLAGGCEGLHCLRLIFHTALLPRCSQAIQGLNGHCHCPGSMDKSDKH